MPRVSVVMTVYNTAQYLTYAIDSVLNQSFEDLELIVIDDGSTDETPTILRQYRRSDGRIRYVRQNRLGFVESLNLGCQLAEGEYIARMDGDDISYLNRIEKQVTFLDKTPTVAVVGGAMSCIDEDGEPTGFVLSYPTQDRAIKKTLLSGSCIAHPTVMMRRDAIRAVDGYRKPFLYAEDYDLWLRMAEHFELANLPDTLLRYRIHKHQVGVQYLEQQSMSAFAAQVSARLRRRTGHDPMDRTQLITRDFLIQLGVSDMRLRRVLLQSYLVWATLMLQSSNLGKAEELLGLAGGLDPDSPFSFGLTYGHYCGSKTACELRSTFESTLLSLMDTRKVVLGSFRLGWALALWQNRRRFEATNEAITACVLQPTLALKFIRWRFRQLYYRYFS